MPINYNAFLRYKIIHKCLLSRQKRQQYINMDALIEEIYEQTGFSISERTFRDDIKKLRDPHNELGFVLPIKTKRDMGYYYDKEKEVPDDIMMPMDKELLKDIAGFLNQFTRFDFFEGYATSLNILIDGSENDTPLIHLDYNSETMGQALIPELRQAIKENKGLILNYQSFKASKSIEIPFQPRFIKIYNNRWFLVGYNALSKDFDALPLDRIQSLAVKAEAIEIDPEKEKQFNPSTYFEDIIGITVMHGRKGEDIIFRVKNKRAQYVNTKPIHSSQEVIKRTEHYMEFKVHLKRNPELITELLSFGSDLEVIKPESLRGAIRKIAFEMNEMYAQDNKPM